MGRRGSALPKGCLWRVAVVCVLGVAQADAQVAERPVRRPRLEIGGHGGVFAVSREVVLPHAGPRVTVNVTPRNAVEFGADVLAPGGRRRVRGLYAFQYKRILREDARRRSAVFGTVGTGGAFSYEWIPERRVSRADGSTVIHPPYREGEVTGLVVASGGLGFERIVAKSVAVRVEAQALVAGQEAIVRGAVGVTIPVGGYR